MNQKVERIKRSFPKGLEIKLIHMDDPHPVPPGTIGEVEFVDDIGQVFVNWKNGRTLPLNIDIDDFERL